MSIWIEENILPEQSFYCIEVGGWDSCGVFFHLPDILNFAGDLLLFVLVFNLASSHTHNVFTSKM